MGPLVFLWMPNPQAYLISSVGLSSKYEVLKRAQTCPPALPHPMQPSVGLAWDTVHEHWLLGSYILSQITHVADLTKDSSEIILQVVRPSKSKFRPPSPNPETEAFNY